MQLLQNIKTLPIAALVVADFHRPDRGCERLQIEIKPGGHGNGGCKAGPAFSRKAGQVRNNNEHPLSNSGP